MHQLVTKQAKYLYVEFFFLMKFLNVFAITDADFVEFIEFEYSSGTLIGCSADVPANQIPGILLLLVHPSKRVSC